jgi:3-oxoacyl-[acyl-carrier protein] reductase
VDLNLKDRVALVLAAGGGLGSAVAESLALEGARVGLADINAAALGETHKRVSALTTCVPVQWDLSELDSIAEHVATVEADLGPIDILVNITGGPPPTPVEGQSRTDWLRYFSAMVLSVVSITDVVLPGMRERGWGRVITSTSSGVVVPIPNLGLSNTLRSSLVGWSKTLAREVGPYGVTCNVVVPGRIATNRISALDEARATREGRNASEVVQESVASIPVGRYGEPSEYADAITFLASPRAAYITGSTIRVDGGLVPSI